jgi:GDP-L-fucose synthase
VTAHYHRGVDHSARIFVAGHRGMVGSALVRRLQARGYTNLLLRTRQELDLLDQRATHAFLAEHRPDVVFIAAAKVGGILANDTYRADFIQQNLQTMLNLVHGSHLAGVERLLFLGSSCIYPKMAPQPIREESLLTGPLEQTNEPYAIAKIAGIKMCESYARQHGRQYISAMPCNLYGPGDNYDPDGSHVIPAIIRKVHHAKVRHEPSVPVWGTGTPRREFLFVDDLADGCIRLMELGYDGSFVNIGSGTDVTIRELVETVMDVVGYTGSIEFDATKPDGTPRKLMDVSRMHALGWTATTSLRDGLRIAYDDFLARHM